jgi:alginate O-acetyltransferase complex protein AlgI
MLFSTLVSFTAGLGLLKFQDPKARRLCLIVPVVADLLLLGFFKYANFLAGSAHGIAAALGLDVPPIYLNVILPVGISFYTFHTISYIVDSYRGTIRPTRNFFEFAAYVSLFSQLVAGPIVRFRQIEEDLENIGSARPSRWFAKGVSFFAIGMVEKVVIADSCASFVDPMLADYANLSTGGAWLAMLGYTYQLYFDFCGYSDMAVGLGYLFGLRIPQNFNSPYKALDPSDFWRRWHISLSTCLRDYVYIPLGGNRGHAYRNLLLTMLIGGLWHGANWTFVVWGAYHGLLLVAYKRLGDAWDRLPAVFRQVSMFVAVLIGWVFFRATDFVMAKVLLTKMFWPSSGVALTALAPTLVLMTVCVWCASIGPNAFDIHRDWKPKSRDALWLGAAIGACLALMAGSGSSPFLYFQF